jgi:hypothetical protein
MTIYYLFFLLDNLSTHGEHEEVNHPHHLMDPLHLEILENHLHLTILLRFYPINLNNNNNSNILLSGIDL